MNCSYCNHENPEDETRCRRCGLRLNASPEDSTQEWPVGRTTGNLAAAPAPARSRAPAVEVPQRALFSDRPASNVIPFETLTAGARSAPPRAEPPGIETPRTPARPGPKVPPRRAASPRPDIQQELDFLPLAPVTPRTLKTRVEASIFCDAPVATLMHRSLAAVLDFSMILIGYGLFALAFWVVGNDFGIGAFPLSKLSLIVYAAAFAVIWAFYGLLWMLGNRETPGMRWTHLCLTNFDGFPPEKSQRVLRYFATCLSVATAGFGLLWALVDEESLTWQDHISKTFPTFRRVETNFCRRP